MECEIAWFFVKRFAFQTPRMKVVSNLIVNKINPRVPSNDSKNKRDKVKFYQISKQFIAILFLAVWAFIEVNLLVSQHFIPHLAKRQIDLPNLVLLLLGLTCVAVLLGLGHRRYKRFRTRIELVITQKTMVLLSVSLCLFQMYLCYHIYFLTDWDVRAVLKCSTGLANNDVPSLCDSYYSIYPNNLLLTYLYSLILKVNGALGLFASEGGLFPIIAAQCVLSGVTAYLVYRVTYEFTQNKILSLFALGVYSLFMGCSPWFAISYSDATGILFPIAIFHSWQLSQKTSSGRTRCSLYALVGLSSYIGFKIKPQIVIIAIAIVSLSLWKALLADRKEKSSLGAATGPFVILAVFLLSSNVFGVMFSQNKSINPNPEMEFGMSHYLMTGWNESRQGLYSDEDVTFSGSFKTKKERAQANLQVLKRRILDMGFSGVVTQLVRKTLINYGDGSFAWQAEGKFFDTILPEKDANISPFLRSFYYQNGKNEKLFFSSFQCIWLTVLTFASFAAMYVFKRPDQKGDEMSVMLLSLIGVTLFVTLFEARARYLFPYAPIFIVSAVVGLYMILQTGHGPTKPKTGARLL